MSAEIIEGLATACANLSEVLSVRTTEDDRSEAVLQHIKELLLEPKRIEDFKSGLEWFNVLQPLTLSNELKGKIVILDFFTYCCINCMHILPDLKALEHEYSVEDGLVVVGVHSAKFDNEKDSENIHAAVQRYEISHPVVNDAEGIMWNQLGIPCWPTLLILGPSGEPLFIVMGEGKREDLFLFVKTAVKYFQSELKSHSLPVKPLSRVSSNEASRLLFPGKIASCSVGGKERLAVSDSGHHGIVIVTSDGKIEFEVGGGAPGFVDGDFKEARFHSPQGVAFYNRDLLYVADTENHSIRLVNLTTLQVSTVAGNGSRGSDQSGGELWTGQPLSSPWDLVLASSSVLRPATGDEQVLDVLLIAMAGSHQIWALFLDNCQWWKNKSYARGTCVSIVGSGKEENRNNSYPHAASFAQPSGLSLSSDSLALYVADSESSSVRRVSLLNGKVSAVVGGDRSPTNLFSYGDVDGKQYDAKLQHPLAVACSGDRLYVADSYNHKVKVVDLKTNVCSTVLGSGKSGHSLGEFTASHGVQLNEPGGLCLSKDGQRLYIADTNNHCVKVAHLATDTLQELRIVDGSTPTETDCGKRADSTADVNVNSLGGDVSLKVEVTLDDGLHFTPDAPQMWRLVLPDSSWGSSSLAGDLGSPVSLRVAAPPRNHGSSDVLTFNCKLYFCQGDASCFVRNVALRLIVVRSDAAPRSAERVLTHLVKL